MTTTIPLTITWEQLPPDYPLPDDPVDNITQPLLAAALTDSLSFNDRLGPASLTGTNYAICATLNAKMVVKAPDWFYIPHITVPKAVVERSYTPQLQGDFPLVVMEFLSETEGGEYSTKPTYPPGKWFFYEQVLQVPYYVIFKPAIPELEVYRNQNNRYDLQSPHSSGHYWLPELQLYLGIWQGAWNQREGYWLRWWDADGNLLLVSSELADKAQQKATKAQQEASQAQQAVSQAQQEAQRESARARLEQQRAEQAEARAAQLLAQLRAAGLDPDI